MTDAKPPHSLFRTPYNSPPSSPSLPGTQPLPNPNQHPVLHNPSSSTKNHQTITTPLPSFYPSTATQQPDHTCTGSSTPSSTNISPNHHSMFALMIILAVKVMQNNTNSWKIYVPTSLAVSEDKTWPSYAPASLTLTSSFPYSYSEIELSMFTFLLYFR